MRITYNVSEDGSKSTQLHWSFETVNTPNKLSQQLTRKLQLKLRKVATSSYLKKKLTQNV
jgi:hypothetical protein